MKSCKLGFKDDNLNLVIDDEIIESVCSSVVKHDMDVDHILGLLKDDLDIESVDNKLSALETNEYKECDNDNLDCGDLFFQSLTNSYSNYQDNALLKVDIIDDGIDFVFEHQDDKDKEFDSMAVCSKTSSLDTDILAYKPKEQTKQEKLIVDLPPLNSEEVSKKLLAASLCDNLFFLEKVPQLLSKSSYVYDDVQEMCKIVSNYTKVLSGFNNQKILTHIPLFNYHILVANILKKWDYKKSEEVSLSFNGFNYRFLSSDIKLFSLGDNYNLVCFKCIEGDESIILFFSERTQRLYFHNNVFVVAKIDSKLCKTDISYILNIPIKANLNLNNLDIIIITDPCISLENSKYLDDIMCMHNFTDCQNRQSIIACLSKVKIDAFFDLRDYNFVLFQKKHGLLYHKTPIFYNDQTVYEVCFLELFCNQYNYPIFFKECFGHISKISNETLINLQIVPKLFVIHFDEQQNVELLYVDANKGYENYVLSKKQEIFPNVLFVEQSVNSSQILSVIDRPLGIDPNVNIRFVTNSEVCVPDFLKCVIQEDKILLLENEMLVLMSKHINSALENASKSLLYSQYLNQLITMENAHNLLPKIIKILSVMASGLHKNKMLSLNWCAGLNQFCQVLLHDLLQSILFDSGIRLASNIELLVTPQHENLTFICLPKIDYIIKGIKKAINDNNNRNCYLEFNHDDFDEYSKNVLSIE
ncbi:hypothetical protein AB837_00268 [bacterium AB1]|nr:hypothetical protein AB837_00268 [bacterium AB1]